MDEFLTIKAVFNIWNQLRMTHYPSSSKYKIISASRFAPYGCAYVFFSYDPLGAPFHVSLTYYKDGNRINKEYSTDNLHKAVKMAYRYSEELDAL